MAARIDVAYPPVTAVRVRCSRRQVVLLRWEAIASFEESAVQLRSPVSELRETELQPDELLLGRDVLDTQIVDIAGKRLVRVSDVELAREAGTLRVVAVDVGLSSLLRRLGLRWVARRLQARMKAEAVAWEDLHMTSARGHALECSTVGKRLRRLGPAELAQLVARLPLSRGLELLGTVEPARAAGALGAARPRLGGRMLQELPPGVAAPILAEMPADDAVAALRHVGADELEELLSTVHTERAGTLRRLLEHPPGTAGGLMTPDYLTARAGDPIEAIRERLIASPPRLEGLGTVFVVDDAGRPIGAIQPTALLGDRPVPVPVPVLREDTGTDQVVDTFALHDFLALPVVDAEGCIVGAVAVDDVLEELLVERLPGRRRYEEVLSVRGRAPS
jgi:hypothetical protein